MSLGGRGYALAPGTIIRDLLYHSISKKTKMHIHMGPAFIRVYGTILIKEFMFNETRI